MHNSSSNSSIITKYHKGNSSSSSSRSCIRLKLSIRLMAFLSLTNMAWCFLSNIRTISYLDLLRVINITMYSLLDRDMMITTCTTSSFSSTHLKYITSPFLSQPKLSNLQALTKHRCSTTCSLHHPQHHLAGVNNSWYLLNTTSTNNPKERKWWLNSLFKAQNSKAHLRMPLPLTVWEAVWSLLNHSLYPKSNYSSYKLPLSKPRRSVNKSSQLNNSRCNNPKPRTMVLSGVLDPRLTWIQTIKVTPYSFISNLVGLLPGGSESQQIQLPNLFD